jgi:essential nuclear protein 1
MDEDNNVSVGGFSKAIKTKALEESVHDMPAIPMLSDDQY